MNRTQLAAEAAEQIEKYLRGYPEFSELNDCGVAQFRAIIQTAIEKAYREGYLKGDSDCSKAYMTLNEVRADAEYNESWRQWRELLSDGRERALCWNCGYPELIGSDDCRNCSTNFDPSKRIPVQPAHASEQEWSEK